MKSQQTMAVALGSVTMTMKRMNKVLNLPSLQKITTDFERLSEMQSIKQELFEESIDGVLQNENEGSETEELVNKVFDEVGLNINDNFANAPTNKIIGAKEDNKTDAELLARLESLRKI